MFMLPLFVLLRRMAEATIFLSSFFLAPEISLFWDNSFAITHSGTQKILSTPVERKNLIGSSLLTSLNDPDIPTLFYRSFLDIFFAPSSLAPWRCFRTWLLITYQFFYLSLSLWSGAPTSVSHPSIFRKLAGMTLTIIVLLTRNTGPFSILCCCSLHFSDTECGQIFDSFWPHQTPF